VVLCSPCHEALCLEIVEPLTRRLQQFEESKPDGGKYALRRKWAKTGRAQSPPV
jgi:hypothetical protein